MKKSIPTKTDFKEINAGKLANNFAEVLKIDNNSFISDSLIRNLLESIPINISVWQKGKVLYANPSFYETFGIKKGDLDGLNKLVEDEGYVTIHPDDFSFEKEDAAELKKNVGKGIVFHREMRMKSHIEKDYRWFNTYVVKGKDPDSDVTIEIDEDITVSKTVTQELEAALKAKDVLMKEIHHRVKNNFQVISSLIRIQLNMPGNKSTKVALEEILSRVSSMTMVHEKLYKSKDLSRISIKDQLNDQASNLAVMYNDILKGIKINMDIDDIQIGIDTAIPLSLITNELLSNSLKCAFEKYNIDNPEINIVLKKKGNTIILKITDNGIGFPEHILNNNISTLGLMIADTLTKQLNGTMKLSNKNGASAEVIFKI